MFGKSKLQREIDDAVSTALKKKKVTTQMASDLFEDSLLPKPLALLTPKEVEKSLKEFKLLKN